MMKLVCLCLQLLVAISAWSQTGAQTIVNSSGTTGESQMQTPPPVSGEAYSTTVGSQVRSNYLRFGWSMNSAYSDNILGDAGSKPVSDASYTIWPTIAIDEVTSRMRWTLDYSPGFTVYQHTNSFDHVDQNMALDFHYRLSPHITASVRDTLHKVSNALNQPDPLSDGGISGLPQAPTTAVFATAANQISNQGSVELTYQFSRNGMLGAAGSSTILHYFDRAQVPGLYDSTSSGSSVFYNHRLSERQYAGANYQYLRILADPDNSLSLTHTHSLLFFYTIYVKPHLSFSVSAGPQHFDVVELSYMAYRGWSPAVTASMGWQGRRTSFAASYAQLVSAGGGLADAFKSKSASGSASWQLARSWQVGSGASYGINKSVGPSTSSSNLGGHSILGTVAVQHPLSEHLNVEVGYTRLHQSYSVIPLISSAPDCNREFVTISYQFARPLGR